VNGGALLLRVGAACVFLLAPWPEARGPVAGAAHAAEEHYWPVDRLDVRPQVRTHVMPEYPAELVSGIRGRVVLDLYISRAGAVDRARIVRAAPPGRFEQAALKAFAVARFTPGMRKGQAVPCVLRIEVTFGN